MLILSAAAASILALGAACYAPVRFTENKNAPDQANANANVNAAVPAVTVISDETLKNMTYPMKGRFVASDVTLVAGYSDVKNSEWTYDGFAKLDDVIGRGDVDGDGTEDAVVVLNINQGGTGTWPVVFTVLNKQGKAVPYYSADFEDRAKINAIAVKDTIITFDLTVHGPGEPMCCPTVQKTELYRWYGFENRLEFIGSPDPAAVKANTDFSAYLPITTKIEHFSGMNHAADETDVYRNGALMFTIQPGFPIGGAEGTTTYGYLWEVMFTPVVNGDIKSTLNIKPTIYKIMSEDAPTFVPVEDMNKLHPDQIWLKVSDGSVIVYDIAVRTFMLED